MTYEDILDHCKRKIERLEQFKGQDNQLGKEYEEHFMVAKLIEKQIPKRPDLEADGYADGELVYDTWICPCCQTHYEIEADDYKYCPRCGQAIDWSEQQQFVPQTEMRWKNAK